MSDVYKGELQDYLGNTLYGHSEADVIFCADGETVQEKLAKQEQVFGEATGSSGSLEVNDPKVLATTEATYKLAENMGGLRFGVDSEGNYGYFKEGADTVTPFKTGSTIIDCGTSASFNVKTYYDGDYTKLTVDNFIVSLVSLSGSTSGYWYHSSTNPSGGSMSVSRTSTVAKNYDSSTGKFTYSNNSVNTSDNRWGSDNTKTINSTTTATCRVYLIV